MRGCACTGYMTNPGGVCCQDLPYVPGMVMPAAPPLTEEQVRRIVREELDRALAKRWTSAGEAR